MKKVGQSLGKNQGRSNYYEYHNIPKEIEESSAFDEN